MGSGHWAHSPLPGQWLRRARQRHRRCREHFGRREACEAGGVKGASMQQDSGQTCRIAQQWQTGHLTAMEMGWSIGRNRISELGERARHELRPRFKVTSPAIDRRRQRPRLATAFGACRCQPWGEQGNFRLVKVAHEPECCVVAIGLRITLPRCSDWLEHPIYSRK